MPFSEPRWDGGKASYNAIMELRDLKLREAYAEEPALWVMSLLQAFEVRRDICRHNHKKFLKWETAPVIRGWELSDIAAFKSSWEMEIDLGASLASLKSSSRWQIIPAKNKGMIVLFYEGLSQPMSPPKKKRKESMQSLDTFTRGLSSRNCSVLEPRLDLNDLYLNTSSPEKIAAMLRQPTPVSDTATTTRDDTITADTEDDSLLGPAMENSDSLDVDDKGQWSYNGQLSTTIFMQRLQNQFGNLIASLPTRSRSKFVEQASKDPMTDTAPYTISVNYGLPPESRARVLCQLAFDEACVCYHFIHNPSFWTSFDQVYATQPNDYGAEERGFLPLLYAVVSVGCFRAEGLDKRLYICADACISASRNLIDITRDMQVKGLLSGADWFPMHATYFTILTLTYPILENNQISTRKTDVLEGAFEGMSVLEALAKNGLAIERCPRLPSLFKYLPETLFKPNHQVGTTDVDKAVLSQTYVSSTSPQHATLQTPASSNVNSVMDRSSIQREIAPSQQPSSNQVESDMMRMFLPPEMVAAQADNVDDIFTHFGMDMFHANDDS
ncbi:fungal specific transcription factor domain-containing protein [Trichoderma gamsii]|uniref:Fungal specific transcription factor domain-containing protein n=1 Tax=Trichoderma gamsii TaxID=398673 RepID=A0A2P4ZXP6_9HYPO|nr:fungal specific transcription factor domain-containing protein [Trichoderma gamsii]PON29062.1 fungal specific transcription factor domain-containing protein [Trichoderma gamsii]